MTNNFKIVATSADEFQAISEAVNSLPVRVVEQINSVEMSLLGIDCTLHNSLAIVYLPKEVTQIKEFDDFIGIYCKDYFFRIIKKFKAEKIEYVFFDEIITL